MCHLPVWGANVPISSNAPQQPANIFQNLQSQKLRGTSRSGATWEAAQHYWSRDEMSCSNEFAFKAITSFCPLYSPAQGANYAALNTSYMLSPQVVEVPKTIEKPIGLRAFHDEFFLAASSMSAKSASVMCRLALKLLLSTQKALLASSLSSKFLQWGTSFLCPNLKPETCCCRSRLLKVELL